MRKKLRIFFLTALVVMFAVSSAFALSVEDNGDYEGETIESYNYRSTFTADLSDEINNGKVIWTVTPTLNSDTWLNWYPDSDDARVLVLEGKLPAYNTSGSNTHSFDIVAYVSCDIESDDEYGNTLYYRGTVSSDIATLVLEVEQEKSLVSTDAFTDPRTGIIAISDISTTVSSDYSVLISAYEDARNNTYYATFDELDAINLPEWLSYDIVSVDSSNTVISLKVVYNENYKPKENKTGTVRIPVTDAEDTYGTQYSDYDGFKVGWNVTYNAPAISNVTISGDSTINVDYGKTTNKAAFFTYDGAMPVSMTVPSSISDYVTLDMNVYPNDGMFCIIATPIAGSGECSGDLTFTDSNGKTATTANVTFHINPVITISQDAVEIRTNAAHLGETTSVELDLLSGTFASYELSPDISPDFGFAVTSGDDKITLSITPTSTGSYGVFAPDADDSEKSRIIFFDESGNSDDVILTVVVEPKIEISEDKIFIPFTVGQETSNDDYPIQLLNYKVPVSYTASPDASYLNLSVSSYDLSNVDGIESDVDPSDNTIILSVNPTSSARYDGVLTFYDNNGNSDDIEVVFASEMTVSTDIENRSIDVSYKGNATTITLELNDYYLDEGSEIDWNINFNGFDDFISEDDPTGNGGSIKTITIIVPEHDTISDFESKDVYYPVEIIATDDAGRTLTFTFDIKVNSIPHIDFDPSLASDDDGYLYSVSLDVRFSKDIEFPFTNVAPASCEIDAEVYSEDLSFDVSYTTSSDTEGKITVVITPLTSNEITAYPALTILDNYDNEAAINFTVELVRPAIKISEDSVELSADVDINGANEKTFVLHLISNDRNVSEIPVMPVSYTISTDEEIPSSFDFTVTSDDEAKTVTLSIKPTITGTYNGSLIFYDEYGNSDSVDITLSAAAQDMEISPDVSGDSTIVVGTSQDLTFTVRNVLGGISYDVVSRDSYAGVTVRLNLNGNTLTLNVDVQRDTPSGTYPLKIIVKDESDPDRTAEYTVNVNVFIPEIELDTAGLSLDVLYDVSKDVSFDFSGAAPIEWKIDNSDAVSNSADIFASWDVSSDNTSGTITVSVKSTASVDETFDAVLVFSDDYGHAKNVTLTISAIVPKIAIEETEASIDVYVGETGTATLHLINSYDVPVMPVSWDASPVIPSSFDFTVVSTDNTITLSITPDWVLSYDGTITFYDANGYSDSVDLILSADVQEMITSSDTDYNVSLDVRNSQTVTLSLENALSPVTWTYGTLPTGVTINFTTMTDTSAVFALDISDEAAAGTYSFDIVATDGAGRRANYTFTVNVVIPEIELSSAGLSLDVLFGISKDVSFDYSGAEPVGWEIENKDEIANSADIFANWVSTDDKNGTITVSVKSTASVDETFDAVLVFSDDYGHSKDVTLTITAIVPQIAIEETEASIDTYYLEEGTATLTLVTHNASYDTPVKPVSWDASPVIPASFDFTVESDDSSITLSITPTWILSYDGTITFYDVNGYSDSVALTLSADAREISMDSSTGSTVAVDVGTSSDITLTIENALPTVTWTVSGDIPAGVTIVHVSTTDTSATYRVDVTSDAASQSYTFEIIATDGYGRTKSYSFSGSVVIPTIELSNVPTDTTKIIYGNSADITFNYSGAAPKEDEYNFYPDEIENYLSFDVIFSATGDKTGTITVSIMPLVSTDATYDLRLVFSDDYGHEAEANLAIEVLMPKIVISEDAVAINTRVGGSNSALLHLTGEAVDAPVKWELAPEIDAAFGFSVVSASSTVTLRAEPDTVGTYTGVITITGRYGTSDSADLTINVTSEDVPPVLFSITPSADTVAITRGATKTVTLTANEGTGNITWEIGKAPDGISVVLESTEDFTGYFVLTASEDAKSGTVRITATDEADHFAIAVLNIVVEDAVEIYDESKYPPISEDLLPYETQNAIRTISSLKPGSQTVTVTIKLPADIFAAIWKIFINNILISVKTVNGAELSFVTAADENWARIVSCDAEQAVIEFTPPADMTEDAEIHICVEDENGNAYTVASSVIRVDGSSDEELIGSSGTCNAGFGTLAFVLAAVMFLRKKRSK